MTAICVFFQNNSRLLIYTPDDTTMVFPNNVITRHNGIVPTIDTHSNTRHHTTLFDDLTIENSTTSDDIVCLVGDINRIPQPFVGLRNVKFVRNAGLLFGQLLNDSNVLNIDPTSTISWTTTESSDPSEVYNNSGILELYNMTMIRNTIYLLRFKYHPGNIKAAYNLLLVKILNKDIYQ